MELLQVSKASAYPPSSGAEERYHGLIKGRKSDDQVNRFAQCPLNSIKSPGQLVEISEGYQEYRAINRVDSVFGALTGIVDAPQIFTSSLMRFGDIDKLHKWLNTADVIQVEEPWQFDYVISHKPDDTPIVYSSQNFEPELYSHLNKRWRTKPIHRRIRNVEKRIVQRADLVIVCSERDRELYLSEYGDEGTFYVAPHGSTVPDAVGKTEKTDLTSDGGPSPDKHWALFVGSDHGPNVTAVKDLIELSRQGCIPDSVEIVIAGPLEPYFESEQIPTQIHFEGFIQDVKAYYDASDIGLNPITTGAGSNVKVPEYMAFGLAVVTTPFGARGYPISDCEEALIVETDGFGEAICEIVNNTELRTTLSQQGQLLVEEQLNWESISQDLFERLGQLRDSV